MNKVFQYGVEGISRCKCQYLDCDFKIQLTTYNHHIYYRNIIKLLIHNIHHRLGMIKTGYYFTSADKLYFHCENSKIITIGDA